MDWVKNGVFMAILAHGLIGISLVWDKILLKQPRTTNLINYVFWLGAIGIFGLGVIPFGFHLPSKEVMLLGLATGALDLAASYFYYAALKAGEASGALAIMGGFSPMATVLFGEVLLRSAIAHREEIGFTLLVAGGFLMFVTEKFRLRAVLPRVLWASSLFGLDNVLQRLVFVRSAFVPGFVFITLGTFGAAMLLLVRRSWREEIFSTSEDAPVASRVSYFSNRAVSGLGSFLVFYAISLKSPAVVDAVSGLRYVLVFLCAYVLTKWKPWVLAENFAGWVLVGKATATLLVAAGLGLLAAGIG